MALAAVVKKYLDAEFASWVGGFVRFPWAVDAADVGVGALPSPNRCGALIVSG